MITEYGIEAKSNSEIISELGGRFKQYRLFSNLTQKEVAVKAGVSIFTISQFEEAEKLLPPLPMLPSQVKKMNEKKERVRHER